MDTNPNPTDEAPEAAPEPAPEAAPEPAPEPSPEPAPEPAEPVAEKQREDEAEAEVAEAPKDARPDDDSDDEDKPSRARRAPELKRLKSRTGSDDLTLPDFAPRAPDAKSEMDLLYEESFRNIREGGILQGTVIAIDDQQVMVDVGYKSEGVIPLREFSDPGSVKVGDTIDVLLEVAEDQDGMIGLSKRKADRIKNWERIVSAHEDDEVIEGRIRGRVKGGFSVDIGMDCFLPASQVTLRPEGNLDQYIGKRLSFKIIKLNRRRKNVVVSRRVILEKEREQARGKTLSDLEVGQIRKGRVKNITDFGAFVDLGGIDGLLHITDMTWGRISHPSEVLSVGQETEVLVLSFDRESEKISLGMKQRTANPWLHVEDKYPVSSRQRGRVVNITDYGAFVELEEGVEGLIHISEMSWTKRLGHPSEVVSVSDNVEVVVLSIDRDHEKISLGMKQVEPNPWTLVQRKYPEGTKVTGIVRNITDYGAFVELEEGIDGLIHVSDMSWSGKVTKASQVVSKGATVETVVLSVDPANKKISLGLKQLQPDPWQTVPERYHVGDVVQGTVTKVVTFGAFVEVEDGVEGLIHISQLSDEHVAKAEDVVTAGGKVTSRIIRLDVDDRKMGLSMRETTDGDYEESAAQPAEAKPAKPAKPPEPADDGRMTLGAAAAEGLAHHAKVIEEREQASSESPPPPPAPPEPEQPEQPEQLAEPEPPPEPVQPEQPEQLAEPEPPPELVQPEQPEQLVEPEPPPEPEQLVEPEPPPPPVELAPPPPDEQPEEAVEGEEGVEGDADKQDTSA